MTVGVPAPTVLYNSRRQEWLARLVYGNRPSLKLSQGSREVYFFLSFDSIAISAPNAIIKDNASNTVISLTPFLQGVSQTTLEEPIYCTRYIIPKKELESLFSALFSL